MAKQHGKQHIVDEGSDKRYFHIIPHMADDELDTYQYRLYGHYKRVCGENGGACWEGVRTTAGKLRRFSVGMVSKTRAALAADGWITCTEREDGSIEVRLVDKWAENVARYARPTRSPGEHPVHQVNTNERGGCSPSEPKNNHIEEEHTEEQPASSLSDRETGRLWSNLLVSGTPRGHNGSAGDGLRELENEFPDDGKTTGLLVEALQAANTKRQSGGAIGSAYGWVAAYCRNKLAERARQPEGAGVAPYIAKIRRE